MSAASQNANTGGGDSDLLLNSAAVQKCVAVIEVPCGVSPVYVHTTTPHVLVVTPSGSWPFGRMTSLAPRGGDEGPRWHPPAREAEGC